MNISISIPADAEHKPLAAAIGQALLAYAGEVGKSVTSKNSEGASLATTTSGSGATFPATGASTSNDTLTQTQTGNSHQTAQELVPENNEETPGDLKSSSPASSTTGATAGPAAGTPSQSVTTANAAGAQVDEKGVPFNPDFCGKAAKPFYGSGKTKGQWKKKVGVSQDDYDEWYAGELYKEKIEEANDTGFDASKQFGNNPKNEGAPKFATGGDFMQWVAEQQAAGNLNTEMVEAAYQETGIGIPDLFDPANGGIAAQKVYDHLSELM